MSDEPLCDPDLEREVLGNVLLRPEILMGLDLSEGDFYSEAHVRIWRACCWLGAEGLPIHESSVAARLADLGQLGPCGGHDYLLGLLDRIPYGSTEHYARLRKLARLRSVRAASQRLVAACNLGDEDEAVRALAGVSAAALAGAPRNRVVDAYELCEGLTEEQRRGPDPGQLFHPGYQIMREVMGLVPEASTVCILARTNVGKTTFALEVLARMAARNVVCGYVSLEDQRIRMRARVGALFSGLSSRAIIQHQLNERGHEALEQGLGEIQRIRRHLHFSVLQGGTANDVCAALSELAERGVRVFVVDYLQKIRGPRSKQDSRVDQISEAMSKITSHVHKLRGVLFLVSQCSRDKDAKNECPSLNDGKGTGDLENECDMVIGLWREVDDDYSPIWARMLKTKDGGLGGSWCMERSRQTGRLEELADSHRMAAPDARGDWSHGKQQGNGRRR